MKRLLSLGVLLAVLAIGGCQRETAIEETPEAFSPASGRRFRTVSVQLETGREDTKSIISVDAEDFRRAYLFAFNASTKTVYLDEQGQNIAIKTESKTFNWTIPVGPEQVMDVYAVVNPDADNTAVLEEFLSRNDVTETDVEALIYVCGNALSLSCLETEGMPMSGCLKGVALESSEDSFTLTIKRLFSRYDMRLNVMPFAEGGWTVEAAEVLAAHSNTRVPFFYTGDGIGVRALAQDLAMVDMATDSDLEGLNAVGADGKSSGSLTLYFPENCQGDIGGASAWNTVYADLEDAVACCSYAEFVIRATHPSLGERSFKYRFYPGQNDDMCSNFDIIRNVRKKVSLTLRPDLSSEGFRWVYDGSLRVAPGESLTVRYETTLDEALLCFSTFRDGLPSDYLQVEHQYAGRVTVKARSDTPEGAIFQLQGGDASGQISDKVNVLATSAVSFWKDVELLHTPEYRGQWMVMRLPENVFGEGDYLQATVRNYILQNDGSYSPAVTSNCQSVISPGVETFENGKTGIFRPHIWFDPSARLLYVYSHISQPQSDNYSTLTLCVMDHEGGQEYELHRKDFVFRQKDPVLRLRNHLSGNDFTYETTINTENQITAQELSFVLVDADNNNKIIPNRDFRWGGHGNYTMPGMTYAPENNSGGGYYYDNLFQESQTEYDYNDSDVDDFFQLSYPGTRDEGSWDFDLYNFSLRPREQDNFAYGEQLYFLFYHSFFSRNEVHIHPTCELRLAPVRSLTLMEALGGTNDPDEMKCSSTRAGEEFFLMYGFRQTFFVKLENLTDITPAVSLSSTSALRYSLTKVQSRLYRLDCWLDHYDAPGSGATPYTPVQTSPDPEDGDYDVTISVSSGGYYDTIVCHVLHKRFRIGMETPGQRDLKLSMWNPLGFVLEASCTLNTDYRMYWYRHPLKEMFDGPCFNQQSASFVLSASLASSPLLGQNVPTRLEKASRDLRGIRCTYARDVHPDFIAHNFQAEDLILYYPAAEAVSLSGSLNLSSEGFISSVAGLSLNGIVFNLDNFIAYSTELVRFSYTMSTLSEYYLQTAFYETTDTWYYDYRFATPVHWSELNPQLPFHFNSDTPIHIGGADVTKTIAGTILYRGNGSFHAQDPAIGI